MKHVWALIIKYIVVSVILEAVLLPMSRMTFGEILFMGLVVTIVAYLIGDLVILRKSNNITASICDVVLAFLVIYPLNFYWYRRGVNLPTALVASVIIGIGEWFFHKYLLRQAEKKGEKRTET